MLKMNGCGYCDKTIKNIKDVLKLAPRGGKALRFFCATSADYDTIDRFVSPRAHRVIQSVQGFPTLFVIKNKEIVKQAVGLQSVNDLQILRHTLSKP